MLEQLLTLNVFGFFLLFSRVGTAFSFMPGFSSSFFPARMRLGLALAVCFVLAPVLIAGLPVRPPTIPAMALLIIGEILIGAFRAYLQKWWPLLFAWQHSLWRPTDFQ